MIYYIIYNGQTVGPMNAEQIFSYSVDQNTMVSADGGDWRPLYTYPELMHHISTVGNAAGTQRQVGFGEAISRGFKNYCNFSGRASLSEFWWWQLFLWIISMGVSMFSMNGVTEADLLSGVLPASYWSINGIFYLIFLLPTLGLTVRRLHDTGRSGWWVLLNFIFCIGWIILLVWYCKPSQEGTNQYGPMPNCE